MTKILAGVEYYNAVVPEFDSRGCPDLLGWDEAMHNKDEDERDVWAVFHDKDVAELCKPVIEQFFNKHHKDNYDEFTSGEPTFLFEEDREEISTEEATLDWFWDEIVGDCFSYDLWSEKDGVILDANAEPFDWDGGGYRKQKPAFRDYLATCSHYLAHDFKYAIKPVDCSGDVYLRWLQVEQAKLIELGRKLYGGFYN
jgi:hypothetical protein